MMPFEGIEEQVFVARTDLAETFDEVLDKLLMCMKTQEDEKEK